MEENKKEYSVIGTVTIGTDEYRDLLQEKFDAQKRESEWHTKWYDEYCEKNKIVEENKKLREELDKLKDIIKKNCVNIKEDGITLFMSMFGEE